MATTEDATTTDLSNLLSRENKSGNLTSHLKKTKKITVKKTTVQKRQPKEEKPQLKARAVATVKRKSELNLLINLSQTERTIKKERIQETVCRCDR